MHLSDSDLLLLRKNVKEEVRRRKISPELARFIRGPSRARPVVAGSSFTQTGRLSVPQRKSTSPNTLAIFMDSLMAQDWSDIYPESGGESKFYVYAHIDPREPSFSAKPCHGGNWGGLPFYIGKGCGNRAYDLKRNEGHGRRLRILREEGFGPEHIVKIIYSGLTSSKALEVEAKLIHLFGISYDKMKKAKRSCLLNLDEPEVPKFDGVMKFRDFMSCPEAST